MNEKISIYNAHYIATAGLEQKIASNNRAGGRSNGFSDPNAQLSPQDLYGHSWNSGVYDEMNKSHPIISSVMDRQADTISNMAIDIEPSGDTVEHHLAAEYCKYMINNMSKQSFRSFIRNTVKNTSVFGHVLYEVRWIEETEKVELFRIRSSAILEFVADLETGELEGVRINTASGTRFLEAEKVLLISNEDYPGNWWGLSELRKILATYIAYRSTMQSFIASQRNSKGFLSIKETGETTHDSWMAIQEFLTSYYNDKEEPLILDQHLSVEFINTSNGALPEITQMYEKYERTIREALMDSINSLGLHGSRALGESFRINDAQKFREYVSSWEDKLNGQSGPQSNLLAKLCKIGGFDDPEGVAPVFKISDNSEQDIDAQVNTLKTLTDAGYITPDDLGGQTIARIIQSIGLEPMALLESLKREGVSVMSVPEGVANSALYGYERYAARELEPTEGIAKLAYKIAGGSALTPDELRVLMSVNKGTDDYELIGGDSTADWLQTI